MSDPREVIAHRFAEMFHDVPGEVDVTEFERNDADILLRRLSEAGYVVAPRVPTDAMVQAAWDAFSIDGQLHSMRAALTAALAAGTTGDET